MSRAQSARARCVVYPLLLDTSGAPCFSGLFNARDAMEPLRYGYGAPRARIPRTQTRRAICFPAHCVGTSFGCGSLAMGTSHVAAKDQHPHPGRFIRRGADRLLKWLQLAFAPSLRDLPCVVLCSTPRLGALRAHKPNRERRAQENESRPSYWDVITQGVLTGADNLAIAHRSVGKPVIACRAHRATRPGLHHTSPAESRQACGPLRNVTHTCILNIRYLVVRTSPS